MPHANKISTLVKTLAAKTAASPGLPSGFSLSGLTESIGAKATGSLYFSDLSSRLVARPGPSFGSGFANGVVSKVISRPSPAPQLSPSLITPPEQPRIGAITATLPPSRMRDNNPGPPPFIQARNRRNPSTVAMTAGEANNAGPVFDANGSAPPPGGGTALVVVAGLLAALMGAF